MPTNFLHYENSIYGVEMQYPSDRYVEGASNSSIVASFNPQRNYASYVTIQIGNLTMNYTPDQYPNCLLLSSDQNHRAFIQRIVILDYIISESKNQHVIYLSPITR